MAKDRLGNDLQVGDRVTVECVVNNVTPEERYQNVELVTVEPYFPQTDPTRLLLNSKQVERIEPAAAALQESVAGEQAATTTDAASASAGDAAATAETSAGDAAATKEEG